MKEVTKREFANGVVYALHTADGYPIEVTDTFLPFYTKDAVGKHQNDLMDYNIGSRDERWMVGVSCMDALVDASFVQQGSLNDIETLLPKKL